MSSKISTIACSLLACAVMGGATVAKAAEGPNPTAGSYTFTFTGDCQDCTGVQATLQVQNYVLGTQLTLSNLVDFSYSSSVTNFDINPAADAAAQANSEGIETIADSISGSILNTPGHYDVNVGQVTSAFDGLLNSNANFSSSSVSPYVFTVAQNESVGDLDHGTNGTWNGDPSAVSAAPEPSSWLLMIAGVAFAGLMLRRKPRLQAAIC